MLLPILKTDLNKQVINCIGYVIVKTLIKFLSTIMLNKNQDYMGINDNNAVSKLTLNNLFIPSPKNYSVKELG